MNFINKILFAPTFRGGTQAIIVGLEISRRKKKNSGSQAPRQSRRTQSPGQFRKGANRHSMVGAQAFTKFARQRVCRRTRVCLQNQ
jgi:hypothetical protein